MLVGIILLVMGLLIAAVITDIKSRKIPNWIPLSVFGLYLLFLILQWVLGLDPFALDPVASATTGIATLIVFTGLFYFNFLGGGDVKLIAAVAFWAPGQKIVTFLVIMALVGGVLAIFYLLKPKIDREETLDPEKEFKEKLKRNQKNEVKTKKNENKSGNIPYGIAISVGGLFVVNQILTFLTA